MKKYFNLAIIYAILAMISGVFYREFTKFLDFEGTTTLAFTHIHFFCVRNHNVFDSSVVLYAY